MNTKLFSLLCAVLSTAVLAGPGFLGIELREVDADSVEHLTLSSEFGARIHQVMEASAAEQAGLQVDDVIVAYNGSRVEGVRTLQRLVQETPGGRTVTLDLIREGERTSVQATLAEAGSQGFHSRMPRHGNPQPPDFFQQHPWMNPSPPSPSEGIDGEDGDAFPLPPDAPKLGVSVQALSPQLADFLGVESGTGLWIGEVSPEGRGAQAGLQQKDVILQLAGEEIRHAQDITRGLLLSQGKETTLDILRKGKAMSLTLPAEEVDTNANATDEDVL